MNPKLLTILVTTCLPLRRGLSIGRSTLICMNLAWFDWHARLSTSIRRPKLLQISLSILKCSYPFSLNLYYAQISLHTKTLILTHSLIIYRPPSLFIYFLLEEKFYKRITKIGRKDKWNKGTTKKGITKLAWGTVFIFSFYWILVN